MACEKCKETQCIAIGSAEYQDGIELFTDIRFDIDNNEIDANFGLIKDGKTIFSEWTYSAQINFCPFCGEKLPEIK